ncbi:MAG TPA: SRPBCC domain-containing protein [Puia sp.]
MNLLFDFNVDRATNTIFITREFAADLDLVWDAWTKAEILDQWMGPRPLRTVTKEMDFREGGRWLYTMVTPDNVSRGWSMAEFIKIEPKSSFTTRNTFCDENGVSLSDAFSITKNSFKAQGGKTTVTIEKKFNDLATLEMMAKSGYKEGLTMAMVNLDEYFLSRVAEK